MDRERLERLLSALHRTDRSTSVLHRLCVVCTDTTALACAGVSRISSGRHEMVVASDSTAAHVEMLQISLAEGPCLEVMASFHPSLEPDLASTRARGRWPNFARAALDRHCRDIRVPAHHGRCRNRCTRRVLQTDGRHGQRSA